MHLVTWKEESCTDFWAGQLLPAGSEEVFDALKSASQRGTSYN